MNCSVKFLSPILIAGLPFPGCPDGVDALVELLLLLLLPHAARPIASATTSSATMPRCQVRSVIESLSFVACSCPSQVLHGGGHYLPCHRPDAARREHALEQREEPLDRECEHRDHECRGRDTLEAIARLVRDHVAEAARSACESGERRGGHDIKRGGADA